MTIIFICLLASLLTAVLFGRFAHYGNPSHETPLPRHHYRRAPLPAWLRIVGAALFILSLNAAYNIVAACPQTTPPKTLTAVQPAPACHNGPGEKNTLITPAVRYRLYVQIARCDSDAQCIAEVYDDLKVNPACFTAHNS